MKKIVLVGLLLCPIFSGFAQNASHDAKMAWWMDARYGMFIHWGLYALPAGSWKGKETGSNRDGAWLVHDLKIPVADYKALAAQFNPKKFDADEWVTFAKSVGMKYIVVTSKHHDGFAMFKSNASAFNVVDATPFKTDVISAIATACKKHNMKLGLYYSQSQDWTNGGANYGNDPWWDESQRNRDYDQYIDEIVIPQVKELLTFHPDIIWWDTPVNMTKERVGRIKAILDAYPNIIINNRLGGGVGGDFGTPEQAIPAFSSDKYWESCLTTSGSNTWGFKSSDKVWKTPKLLIRGLIEIAAKGGNLLLNVGPDGQGSFPRAVKDTLKVIGNWLKINGESIYGTSAGIFPYLKFGRCTQKGNKLYLQVLNWPSDGQLKIPLQNDVLKAYILASLKTPLQLSKQNDYLHIRVPAKAPDTVATVIVLELKEAPKSSIVNLIPSLNKPATASSEADINSKADYAFDAKGNTLWKPAKDQQTAWLSVNMGEHTSIGAIAINEYGGANIQQFQLEYKDGDNWVPCLKGTSVGGNFQASFKPVRAQFFRLNILKMNNTPQIKSLQLFFDE
jgi:alpha-L-fucosidase